MLTEIDYLQTPDNPVQFNKAQTKKVIILQVFKPVHSTLTFSEKG